MKFSKSAFTRHKIMSDLLSDSKNTDSWDNGKFVWCKLDKESDMVRRSNSGLKVFYVWLVSENLKHVTLAPLDNMNVSSFILERDEVTGKPTKSILKGEDLNTAMSAVRGRADKIIEEKKRQVILDHNQNVAKSTSKSGWVNYTYTYNVPIPIKFNGTKILTLEKGDMYKIRRVEQNKNKVIFKKHTEGVFLVDDLKLVLLINRTAKTFLSKY